MLSWHQINPPKSYLISTAFILLVIKAPIIYSHCCRPVTFKVCSFYVQNYNHNHKIHVKSVHICSNPTSAGLNLRSISTDEKWLMKIKICQINIWHWKLLIKFTAYITEAILHKPGWSHDTITLMEFLHYFVIMLHFILLCKEWDAHKKKAVLFRCAVFICFSSVEINSHLLLNSRTKYFQGKKIVRMLAIYFCIYLEFINMIMIRGGMAQ